MRRARTIAPVLLTTALIAAFSDPAVGADVAYSGLKNYRTKPGWSRYEPVLLVMQEGEVWQIAEDGRTATIRVRSCLPIRADRPIDPAALGAEAEPAAFTIVRATHPPDVRESFDAALRATEGSSHCIVLGLAPDEAGKPYWPILSSGGNGLETPFFPVDGAQVAARLDDARVYASVAESVGISSELWNRACSIGDPRLRFVTLRDVFFASYREQFGRRPLAERIGLFDDILSAMKPDIDPELWVRRYMMLTTWEADGTLLSSALKDRELWVRAAGSGRDRVAVVALGIGCGKGRVHAKGIRARLVAAYLGREGAPSHSGLWACNEVARGLADVPETIEREGSEALIKGLAHAQEATSGTLLRPEVWTLMGELTRRFPEVRQSIAQRKTPAAAKILDELIRAEGDVKGVEKETIGNLLDQLGVR